MKTWLLLFLLCNPLSALTGKEVYERVRPSVAVVVQGDTVESENCKCNEVSAGGGVLVAPMTVLTANHAVPKDRPVQVYFYGSTGSIEGKVTERDEKNDTARITLAKVPERPLVARVSLDLPRAGDRVYAVSHPAGLAWSLSEGYSMIDGIREINREDVVYHNLQVALPVFPGSSGGGVFNDRGELIGLVAGMLQGTSICYAIPIRDACGKAMKCKVEKR